MITYLVTSYLGRTTSTPGLMYIISLNSLTISTKLLVLFKREVYFCICSFMKNIFATGLLLYPLANQWFGRAFGREKLHGSSHKQAFVSVFARHHLTINAGLFIFP